MGGRNMNKELPVTDNPYSSLINDIGNILVEARGTICREINTVMYYVDLVFYHVILKTYVLIDLKRNEVQHEDVGQMNFYLNYFRNEVCVNGDNDPIGIVLGATADKMTMEYAMGGISNQLFVSRYQLYLPDRELLENELWRIMKKQKLEKEDDFANYKSRND